MQPMDVLKTRFQTARHLRDSRSILGNVRGMISQEGPASLYKGMIPVLAIVVPRVSLQFTGLALFTPWLSRAEKAGWSPQGSAPALAGILTGMAQATLLVTPLELIKVRQQTTIGAHQGPLALVLHVIREEGQVLFFLPCPLNSLP